MIVGIVKLTRRLAVDGGGDRIASLSQESLQKFGEGVLQFFKRTAGQGTRDRRIDRRLHFFETKRGSQDVPITFRPTPYMGNIRKLGELSKKNQNEHPVKIVPNSFGITRIGDFLKNANQPIDLTNRDSLRPPCKTRFVCGKNIKANASVNT